MRPHLRSCNGELPPPPPPTTNNPLACVLCGVPLPPFLCPDPPRAPAGRPSVRPPCRSVGVVQVTSPGGLGHCARLPSPPLQHRHCRHRQVGTRTPRCGTARARSLTLHTLPERSSAAQLLARITLLSSFLAGIQLVSHPAALHCCMVHCADQVACAAPRRVPLLWLCERLCI